MLKFLENRDEVVDLLHYLSENTVLSAFKLGVAGSYAEGMNKKSSPIDIVLKLREGEDKSMIGSLDVSYQIHRLMHNVYSNKVQIIWLDLLEKDEVALLNFVRTHGVEANPESAYTNIVEAVHWVDEDEDSDDDRINSSVMTWDEDEPSSDENESSDEGEDE